MTMTTEPRELPELWRKRSQDAKIQAIDFDESLRCADELEAALAQSRAQDSGGEAVYQWRERPYGWHDLSKEDYDRTHANPGNFVRGETIIYPNMTRVLHTAAEQPAKGEAWRCFHCDEHFTDAAAAELHFGKSERETPACQIDGGVLAEVRRQEVELGHYREEDSAKDREMARLRSGHEIALRRAEEAGYAKALKDTNYHEATPKPSDPAEAECDGHCTVVKRCHRCNPSPAQRPEGDMYDPQAKLNFHEWKRDQVKKDGGVLHPRHWYQQQYGAYYQRASDPADADGPDVFDCDHAAAAARDCGCGFCKALNYPAQRPEGDAVVNPLLAIARRNIRQFIAKASFASEADRWSAGQCIDVIEAVLSTPPSAEGDEVSVWQPIKTAPKNGAGILALLPDSNFPVGVRYHDGGWHVAWDNSRLGEFDQPEKWMHIPDDRPPSTVPQGGGVDDADRDELQRLRALVNTPELHDFARGVTLEAAHQRERWGNEHDAGKTAADWFWLVGYLAGKALHSQNGGDTDKALHHTISTAAALANWHGAILGAHNMRPGIDGEAALAPATGERGKT